MLGKLRETKQTLEESQEVGLEKGTIKNLNIILKMRVDTNIEINTNLKNNLKKLTIKRMKKKKSKREISS